MAEEKKEEAKEGGAEGGGSKKKLFIIIGAVVVVLLIGVGAFLALGKSSKPKEGEEGDAEVADDGAEAEHEAAAEGGEHGGGGHSSGILPLEAFIVNLQVKGSFLKTTMQLEFVTPEVPPTVEKDSPKLRDAVIRVLSSKSAQEILSAEGKEKLREELKQAMNTALGSDDIAEIYFTEFIVQ